MPLSIEPSKPRLLHDQQYLNCFMQQCPFSLNQVVNPATNALRELVLSCFQYIDDRHLGELWGPVAKRSSSLEAANAAFFVAATILTQLDIFYTLENVFQFLRSISFFLATSSIPPVKPSLKVHCASRENAIK